MRLSTQVILILVASLAAQCSALRGVPTSNKLIRSLQEVGDDLSGESKDEKDDLKNKDEKGDKGDKEDKKDKGDKEDKEDKKDEEDKKEKSEKADKKEAEKCKKAKKSKEEDVRARRRRAQDTLEDTEEETLVPNTSEDIEESIPFCSHSILSMEECANLDSVRSDGRIISALRIELVHNDEKQPKDIASETEEILAGGETKSQFVGCGEVSTPPTAVRYLQETTGDDEYAVVTRDESERVGVTGVEFNDLKVSRGRFSPFCTLVDPMEGNRITNKYVSYMASTLLHTIAACQNADVPSGSVCDVIQSNVEIYYQSASGEISSDDEQDMNDLLIETIKSQALAGAFDDLGSVESVEVTGSSQGDSTSSDSNIITYVLAAVAAIVVFCLGYWYCTRRKNGHEEQYGKRENVVDTSDEEQSDDEQRARSYASGTETKQQHTVAEIPETNAVASTVQQAKPGNWFGSNDEHPDDEVKGEKTKAAPEYTDKKGDTSSWVAGWFGPTAPADEEC
jgi:hypothetical protein